MNEYQMENQRSRHRSENMNKFQLENQRSRHRVESMSPQQRQSLREREAVRRQFLSVAQEWDDEKPCPHCFHVYLKIWPLIPCSFKHYEARNETILFVQSFAMLLLRGILFI